MTEAFVFCGLVCVYLLSVVVRLRLDRRNRRADPALIARLEYELGFTDERPPSVADILKDAWVGDTFSSYYPRPTLTDEPGAVVYYDPREGTPTY